MSIGFDRSANVSFLTGLLEKLEDKGMVSSVSQAVEYAKTEKVPYWITNSSSTNGTVMHLNMKTPTSEVQIVLFGKNSRVRDACCVVEGRELVVGLVRRNDGPTDKVNEEETPSSNEPVTSTHDAIDTINTIDKINTNKSGEKQPTENKRDCKRDARPQKESELDLIEWVRENGWGEANEKVIGTRVAELVCGNCGGEYLKTACACENCESDTERTERLHEYVVSTLLPCLLDIDMHDVEVKERDFLMSKNLCTAEYNNSTGDDEQLRRNVARLRASSNFLFRATKGRPKFTCDMVVLGTGTKVAGRAAPPPWDACKKIRDKVDPGTGLPDRMLQPRDSQPSKRRRHK